MPSSDDQDITHKRGDTQEYAFAIRDKAGANVDLTGASARWWMGRNVRATGSNVFVKKTTADGGAEFTQTDGLFKLRVYIDPEDTEDLSPGTFYHEAEIIDANGNVGTAVTGRFTLTPDMVRP